MEKAEKKLNRLKDAYEEENHGDLTIGKIETVQLLFRFLHKSIPRFGQKSFCR